MTPNQSKSVADLLQVKAAGYRPPSGHRPSFNSMGMPPFTLQTVEWMRRDPQIRLGMAIKLAPLLKTKLMVKGHPDVIKFVGDTYKRIWQRSVSKMLSALWYTMSAGELCYTQNPQTGQYEFDQFIDFYPQDVSILIQKGQIKGIKIKSYSGGENPSPVASQFGGDSPEENGSKEGTYYFFPKCFLYIHDSEFNSLQGRSEFEGAYTRYMEKNDNQGAVHSRKLWYYKNAFSGGILLHPPGNYSMPTGELIPYRDIARQALEASLNGAVWTFENITDPVSGSPLWQFIQPQMNGSGADLLNYADKLDTEMLRGMEIPDDVISQVSQSGSRAGRSIPLMAFFSSQEVKLDRIFAVIDSQIVRPLTKLNFGNVTYEATMDIDIDGLMGSLTGEGEEPGLAEDQEAGILSPESEAPNDEGNDIQFSDRVKEIFNGKQVGSVRVISTGIRERISIPRQSRKVDPVFTIDFGDEVQMSKTFEEREHPRGGKGTKQGGQFVKKGSRGTPTTKKANPNKPQKFNELPEHQRNTITKQALQELPRGKRSIPAKKPHTMSDADHAVEGKDKDGKGGQYRLWLKSGKPVPPHLKDLRLGPNYKNVKLSMDPDSDILATAVNEKGQPFTKYKDSYMMKNAAIKFYRINKMLGDFEKIVKTYRKDMKAGNENALVMHLIATTGMRPGSNKNTGAEKQAYGATTVLAKHIWLKGNTVRLKFVGKKGVDLDIPVHDPALAALLRQRKAERTANSPIFDTNYSQFGKYAKEVMGKEYAPKDFRTYLGTTTAARLVADMPVPKNPTQYKKQIAIVGKHVSDMLGNTPKIALDSYIDNSVFTEWRNSSGIDDE